MSAADRPSVTPRVGDTITTAEQVHVLPPGSITRDRNGAAWKRGLGSWVSTADHGDPYQGQPLPATVLYVPGEQPRPSVTDNARAEQTAMLADAGAILTAALSLDATGYRIEGAQSAARLATALRAAGRAETTTTTTEDMTTRLAAAEAELDRLCNGGRFIMSIPAREGYDSDLLIQAALSDLRGLLATARTRPTRQQIAQVVAKHDGKPAATTADAVLALLRGGDRDE